MYSLFLERDLLQLHILRKLFELESCNVYNLISSNLNLPYPRNSLSLRFSSRSKLFLWHFLCAAKVETRFYPKSCDFFPSDSDDYLHNSILFKTWREKRHGTNAISRRRVLSRRNRACIAIRISITSEIVG